MGIHLAFLVWSRRLENFMATQTRVSLFHDAHHLRLAIGHSDVSAWVSKCHTLRSKYYHVGWKPYGRVEELLRSEKNMPFLAQPTS